MSQTKVREMLYLAIGRRTRRLQPLPTRTPIPQRIPTRTRRRRIREATTSTGVISLQLSQHKAVRMVAGMAIRVVATVDQLATDLIVTKRAQNLRDKEAMVVYRSFTLDMTTMLI